MQKMKAAASPAAYVAALGGWQAKLVKRLRSTARSRAKLEEGIKWTNLVYFANGPVFVIRSEPQRVLLAFFRGKRLRDIEPRLKASGKFELANFELREDTEVDFTVVRRLVREAVALNRKLGDPTKPSKRGR